MQDDEEGQSLNEYEGKDEREDLGYILLLFVTPPLTQNKSNCLTDIGKGIRSLNQLVFIPKIGLS